ncbi:MAG TPA: hypothetical protein VK524_22390, partial [Polyangiaceae bacterium]|nr:hypothetical protein [Polyangiaceae bacterium]
MPDGSNNTALAIATKPGRAVVAPKPAPAPQPVPEPRPAARTVLVVQDGTTWTEAQLLDYCAACERVHPDNT